MSPAPSEHASHIVRFRALVSRHFGLHFDDGKLELLAEILRRRLVDNRTDATTYLQRLAAPDPLELRALAREVTVGETYFFRNFNHFRALTEHVLPERLQSRAVSHTLELLSAGCASGEEAYSLAMVVRDLHLDPRWRVTVRGVDLNPGAIAKARRGTYSTWSLREVPDELRRRWLRAERGHIEVRSDIRNDVRFDERNLTHDDPELWAPGRWDVVFCRNVLMYFEPPVARAVVARIARSIAPGGYLFVGHAETLRELSDDFELVHTHDTFYYRRLDGTARPYPTTPAHAPADPAELPDTWIETIRLTAERIRRLSEQPTAATIPRPPDVDRALSLLGQERLVEALALFEGIDEAALDPPSALILAALQVQSGLVTAAERVARRLVDRGARVADAEHVLSLCCEKSGAHADAVAHDRRAVALDPSFAMPHLHLGLMAYADGERMRVDEELGLASELLEREDDTRIALFGGGFSRETLLSMCRTTLRQNAERTP